MLEHLSLNSTSSYRLILKGQFNFEIYTLNGKEQSNEIFNFFLYKLNKALNSFLYFLCVLNLNVNIVFSSNRFRISQISLNPLAVPVVFNI